jgi:hypothetical protein
MYLLTMEYTCIYLPWNIHVLGFIFRSKVILLILDFQLHFTISYICEELLKCYNNNYILATSFPVQTPPFYFYFSHTFTCPVTQVEVKIQIIY